MSSPTIVSQPTAAQAIAAVKAARPYNDAIQKGQPTPVADPSGKQSKVFPDYTVTADDATATLVNFTHPFRKSSRVLFKVLRATQEIPGFKLVIVSDSVVRIANGSVATLTAADVIQLVVEGIM